MTPLHLVDFFFVMSTACDGHAVKLYIYVLSNKCGEKTPKSLPPPCKGSVPDVSLWQPRFS